MTTGGFDPNQGQQPFGGQQYGQPHYNGAGQQYGQQQFGAPPQFDSAQQAGTQPFAQPDFGFTPSRPGELLPRLGARVIDGLIVGIPTAVVTIVISLVLGTFLGSALGAILTAVAAVGYFVFLETTRGQTVGKQVLGLRVEGPNGGLPTQQQSLTRNGFYVLAALGGFPFLGFLFGLVGFVTAIVIAVTINGSPTKQGKHDELAGGTRVVQG
ncbi:RDD family protein [Rhodococcus koreensis]|uniref:RDD family protein n=1 Tax=Rhodococcus koreensis TaxID=99653 RepID=UPI00197CF589|nr:RDD family protein [Rhodococcus koreensis]QSE81777.1 RDD family protein [Rhodococcus koreensis]